MVFIAHHMYSMPAYLYLANDYGTQLLLFTQTRRPRANYRDFGLSSHILHEMVSEYLLPEATRSSCCGPLTFITATWIASRNRNRTFPDFCNFWGLLRLPLKTAQEKSIANPKEQ